MYLVNDRAFRFAAPQYVGTQKTMIRFRLDIGRASRGGDKTPETERGPIYSNAFAGGVNPAQFTTKQGHKPTSIMDPYND